MKTADPGRLAETLVSRTLSPFFGESVTSGLGREIYATIRSRLRYRGIADPYHAEEILALTLFHAFNHLKDNRRHVIENPRAWLHEIARNTLVRYLKKNPQFDSETIYQVLEGEIELPEFSDEKVLNIVRKAIEGLPPRYQQLIQLDLVEGLSSQEIQEQMSIKSYGYFRKLKSEAFSGLRKAIQSVLAKEGEI